jgi:predicted AAA+ superfamily ATPase
MNAQVVNVSSIARDAAVSRPTVDGYFEVLVDTLIGFWLPAWQPRAKVKEVGSPKFFFFDPGVVRGLSGLLRKPMTSIEQGHLFETLIINEVRAWMSRENTGGELGYWATPSHSEIDLIYRSATQDEIVGVEIKSSERWRSEYSRTLKERLSDGTLQRGIGIYLGGPSLKDGAVEVLNWREFLKLLWQGKLFN